MSLIYIIEDEVKISEILSAYLIKNGYQTHIINTGKDAVASIVKGKPDLIILDLMLPEVSGFDICKQLRNMGLATPIIMITARIDETDRVKGLDLGADDYVCKPFLPNEVVARVKANLRRVEVASSNTVDSMVSYKNITVDIDRFMCFVSGNEIELTRVELRLLHGLVVKPKRIFSREALMDLCYQDNRIINDRTIDSHLRNLRKKLVGAEKLIQTVYGEGYKLE